MNEFEQAKKEYEQIPVPEELADRVQAGIRQGRAKRMQRKWKRGAGAVAACLVLDAFAFLLPGVVATITAMHVIRKDKNKFRKQARKPMPKR